jgi:protein-tyrosine phosphatase
LTQIAGDAPCAGGEQRAGREQRARGEQCADSERGRARELVAAEGRRIDLPGLFNLRDVGGYPTASGAAVPWRTLLRSDALHQLDADGIAALAALRVRTIVDLRTHAEVEFAPSPLDELPVRHTHVSILGGDLEALPLELEAIYAFVIDECGEAIADAIRPLCRPEAFPALVHCSAGKDRTGIVIAMMLSVLGVPDEVIAADYALSGGYLDPEHTAAIGQLQAGTGLGEELTSELLGSPPQLILASLARARAAHGSIESYLTAHGLTAADLAALRAALAG